MSDSPFLPRAVSRARLLFGVIGVVIATLLSTVSAAAQDTPIEQEIERDMQVRVGFYLAAGPSHTRTYPSSLYGSDGNINSAEDDVMPYPAGLLSIRYKKYQAAFGWGEDNYDKNDEDEHNERIAKFIARYNYYPVGKAVYIFGGPVIWHFHKKFNLKKLTCTDYGSLSFGCEGELIFTDIKTDRPDGKSTTLGINAGFGIEYTLFNLLVVSHEIEFYRSACKRKDFICKGADLKLLGLHLEF